MLIAWLLGVLVFEVGFLLICGIIIYKEERIASQAKGKELVRTILDQEEEKWKELQRRWMETAILSQELREAELQMRKLEENSREGLDLETRFPPWRADVPSEFGKQRSIPGSARSAN